MKKRNSNLEKLFIGETSNLLRKYQRQVGDSPLTVEYDYDNYRLVIKSGKPLKVFEDKLILKSMTSVRYSDGVELIMRKLPTDSYYYHEKYKYVIRFKIYPKIYKFTIMYFLAFMLFNLLCVLKFFSYDMDKYYILFNLVCGLFSFSYLIRR